MSSKLHCLILVFAILTTLSLASEGMSGKRQALALSHDQLRASPPPATNNNNGVKIDKWLKSRDSTAKSASRLAQGSD
ncbi:hypothetical protein CASFOL_029971 [Castilleja foliolosa]|uniref:Uncharacterized protein n=1 Tax=Castilleja foliolosa TaxID=1961234 RepID=A0ABD3CA18_9LAMI